MSKTPYMPRVSDALLKNELESSGAVLIEGPKWCGKTSRKVVSPLNASDTGALDVDSNGGLLT